MFLDRIKTIFSFPVVLASLLVWWLYRVAKPGLGDPDLWWHMENARYLFSHHHLPRFDAFSYTTMGHPWMDHEWLAEVPYYLAWHAFGPVGVYVTFIVILEAILLGVFYLASKSSGNVKGAWLVSCFSVLLVILLVLQQFRAKGKSPLWMIPVAFCLWINSHGSWLIGMTVFGIIIASGLVEGNWGRVEAVRWSPRQLRQLLVTLAASVAALFVNPFGYHLVFYPFDMAFKQKLTVNNIEEWASVDFHDARGKIVLVLLVVLLVGALLSRHRWELGELGLAVLAVYSGLTYVRFLFLAAILLAPLLAKFLDFLPPYRPEIDKHWLNGVILAGFPLSSLAREYSGRAFSGRGHGLRQDTRTSRADV